MITNYLKNCGVAKSGIKEILLVGKKGDIASSTFTAAELLSGLTMKSTTEFAELQADFNTAMITSEGTTGRISTHTTTLTAKFGKTSNLFTKTLEELKAAINCGLVFVYRNGSGKWFISGIDPVSRDGASQPFMSMTHNYTSGEGVADEAGDQWTISFSKASGEVDFYEVDEATSLTLTNRTATWVNWAV